MQIKQICNNKATIVYHNKKRYLFSYDTLMLSSYYDANIADYVYIRHFKNQSLLSNTTLRHVREFMSVDHVKRDEIMKLKYKEVA